jgi:hypothetical protein
LADVYSGLEEANAALKQASEKARVKVFEPRENWQAQRENGNTSKKNKSKVGNSTWKKAYRSLEKALVAKVNAEKDWLMAIIESSVMEPKAALALSVAVAILYESGPNLLLDDYRLPASLANKIDVLRFWRVALENTLYRRFIVTVPARRTKSLGLSFDGQTITGFDSLVDDATRLGFAVGDKIVAVQGDRIVADAMNDRKKAIRNKLDSLFKTGKARFMRKTPEVQITVETAGERPLEKYIALKAGSNWEIA